jgi:hypothetical protein
MSSKSIGSHSSDRSGIECRKTDFSKTMGFIKNKQYYVTGPIRRGEIDGYAGMPFSMVYKIIENPDNYERRRDTYDTERRKWSFSFCGVTDFGNTLRVTVRPSDNEVSIFHIERLKKTTTASRSQANFKEQNRDAFRKIKILIKTDRISYTKHAELRMIDRNVTDSMVKEVLQHGEHKWKKDKYDPRGWVFTFFKTIDKRDIYVKATPFTDPVIGDYMVSKGPTALIISVIDDDSVSADDLSRAEKTISAKSLKERESDTPSSERSTSSSRLKGEKHSKKRKSTSSSSSSGNKSDEPSSTKGEKGRSSSSSSEKEPSSVVVKKNIDKAPKKFKKGLF